VRLTSAPWAASEVEAAGELRNAIVGLVLRRAEEMAELNDELTRSNRELEAFSYSVSHDLRAPLRHVVGYAEMLRENAAERLNEQDERCIRTIIESSEFAGMLVDKLLAFSHLGRGDLQCVHVDMNQLVREVQRDVMHDAAGRQISWRIEPLPPADGDLMMLRMALRNLLENAIKYTRTRPETIIEVGSRREADENVYFVRDNGVGFDMQYVDKLFGVFQRLHRMEDYEGTGIGLANVRRVIGRHGGRTWAEGVEGSGAAFYFSLPVSAQ
jgi:light-regulated signal transduction histidine kinase (bacteriophytochrome)